MRAARWARSPTAKAIPPTPRRRSSWAAGPTRNRPGYRVRLLLLPRGLRAGRDRRGVDHGQLATRRPYSTDYDTFRPALFRAADRRGRPRADPRGNSRTAPCWGSSSSSAARRPLKLASRWKTPASRSSARPPDANRPGRGPRALPGNSSTSSTSPSRSTPSPAAATKPSPARTWSANPCVIRPSYVLGGRAMEIVRDDEQLDRYIPPRRAGLRRQPGAARPVPLPRHRGGRGRALRRTPARSSWPG